jgi:SAM-dependent methyltransferase
MRLRSLLSNLSGGTLSATRPTHTERLRAIERAIEAIVERQAAISKNIDTLAKQLDSIAVNDQRARTSAGELANQINAAENRIMSLSQQQMSFFDNKLGTLANQINAVENHVINIFQQHSSLLDSKLGATNEQISISAGELANQMNAVENRTVAISQQHSTYLTHLSDTLRHMIEILHSAEGRIGKQQGDLANQINEMRNYMASEHQMQSNLAACVDNQLKLINEALAQTRDLNLLVARGAVAVLSQSTSTNVSARLPIEPPTKVLSLDKQIANFRKAAPYNVERWLEAFAAAETAVASSLEGNLSHEGSVGANYFRMFVNAYARGRILDVGCGPIALPIYLADWPCDQIAGVDPLPPFGTHPFPFVQTFAENIPWQDGCFETVVIATSLDHIYLLDIALAEIRRVLKPDGRLLIWTGLLKFSTPYDPYGPKIEPPDGFHLFHPGRNWLFSLFEHDYRLIDRIATVGSAEFLAFERRHGVAPA